MAAKISFVFILSLLLQASLSLPISLDVKTVQSTDSVPENGLTKPVFNSEKNLRPEEENKLVRSLSSESLLKAFVSFEANHGKRTKRHITKTQELCPKDTIQYGRYCVPEKEYEENGLEGSDDYEAKR